MDLDDLDGLLDFFIRYTVARRALRINLPVNWDGRLRIVFVGRCWLFNNRPSEADKDFSAFDEIVPVNDKGRAEKLSCLGSWITLDILIPICAICT